ncbi:MAG: hypothetical protein V2J20_04545 [Wenzhouxiangella sp.]|jgi:hypothetical protein|nr:hypothetical protein [Wenzhouxiangella sp.]
MHIKWLELILVAGVALGIGFWQLYDVNKSIKADKENSSPSPDPDSGPAKQATETSDSGSKPEH